MSSRGPVVRRNKAGVRLLSEGTARLSEHEKSQSGSSEAVSSRSVVGCEVPCCIGGWNKYGFACGWQLVVVSLKDG